MSKKILDAAVTVAFCICLIVTSNIQERGAGYPAADVKSFAGKSSTAVGNHAVAAGVSLILFQQSFTTESDEKTGIERNDIIWVAAPEDAPETGMLETSLLQVKLSEQTIAGNHRSDTKDNTPEKIGESEEEVVPAGLAEPAEPETEAVPAGLARPVEPAEEPQQQVYANRWNINLTEEEIDLLARIVWLEANGEPVEGQEAVVEVVFNRMTSGLFPTTLYDVLSQKNPVQFCSWKNREIAKPTDKEYQSIHQVLDGNTNILRNDTMYFSTHALTSNLDKKIGGHSFCY